MEFTEWLQNELNKRGWSQRELVRRSDEYGNKISKTQLTNILLGKRNAGPDSCIAIAQTLELPRETVFRARGWLSKEPEDIFLPKAPDKPEDTFSPDVSPILLQLDKRVRDWQPPLRQMFLQAVNGLADVIDEHGKKPDFTGLLLGGP